MYTGSLSPAAIASISNLTCSFVPYLAKMSKNIRFSLLPDFGIKIWVMFQLMFVHIIFSSVWVAKLPHFGKSCQLG